MTKKKSKKELIPFNPEIISLINEEIENNVEYSLEVDPTNKYGMSEKQKEFIKYYCEYKNISLSAELSEINKDLAKKYFLSYSSQEEIKRINKAMYQRQFKTKMMTLNEVGSYLTNLITEDNLFEKDKLEQKDKLKVIEMLMDLYELMNNSILEPSSLINKNIEEEIKTLSLSTINNLLNSSNKKEGKKEVEKVSNKLSAEEEAMIKSLPANEILKIVNNINKEDKK